jgi:peptidoglycan hydrolase-like protein with peptidoglycan-binding domain
MTPRQARVALAGFVLLAAGVTSNALYFQGGAHRAADKAAAPSPSRTEPRQQPATPKPSKGGKTAAQAEAAPEPVKGAPEPAKSSPEPVKSTQALKVRMVRVATIGEPPPEPADAETVRAVQNELNRRGYGPVVADGVMRPAGRAAIMAFEHEHRLALTGEASQELLKHLVIGVPPPAETSGLPEVASAHAQALIKDVQRQLSARGYRPGAVDGRLSSETIAALRAFEADQGMVPKGRISVAVLERLRSGIAGGGRHPTQ